jgi:hypothetical protein
MDMSNCIRNGISWSCVPETVVFVLEVPVVVLLLIVVLLAVLEAVIPLASIETETKVLEKGYMMKQNYLTLTSARRLLQIVVRSSGSSQRNS